MKKKKIVLGDKTKTNVMIPRAYKKWGLEEVSKFYKKAPASNLGGINTEAKKTSTKYGIVNKVRTLAEKMSSW